MQLYDKDLLSVQEVRELVERAKAAQQELSEKSQQEVDAIVKSIADAGVRNARRLAKLAHEETGFGVEADKVIKNVFASRDVYEHIKDMKTIGELGRDEERKIRTIAVPVGVIAGLIPSTNPTSTALYKSEIAIKAGNAIVFSPHPNARNCILETVKVIRQAIVEAGGNEDLVSCITIPTLQATDNLMRHADVSMILATGGSAMVRAAYSSGTPAIGVGPGNGPAYIEKTADLPLAVKRIIDSKTFDNGTICASEQSVVCDTAMEPAVRAEMERQGAYFLTDEQIAKLGGFILRANGTMNPMIVGKSAAVIAELAGIEIPAGTKVLVARETGIGRGHPLLQREAGADSGVLHGGELRGGLRALRGDPSLRGSRTHLLHSHEGQRHGGLLRETDPGFENRREYPQRSGRNRRNDGPDAGADPRLRSHRRKRDLRERGADEPSEPALCGGGTAGD